MDASDILKDRAVRAYPSGGPALSRGSAAGVGVSGVPAAAASGGAADPTGFRRQLTALRQGEPSGAGSSQRAGPEGGMGAAPAADAARITVRRGDTLTSLVRAQWKAQGQAPEALSAQEAHRRALRAREWSVRTIATLEHARRHLREEGARLDFVFIRQSEAATASIAPGMRSA